MKKLKILITFFTIILMIGTSTVSAQGLGLVGKLLSKKQADVLFGNVKVSIPMKASVMRKALDNANNYVLLTVKNNRIIIRDENKKSLSNENESLEKNETLYIFSKSLILQLLQSANSTLNSVQASGDTDVFVELRASVLTVTAGATTLEFALPCPPMCAN